MAKFWISTPRYMQQLGQVEPAYLEASPGRPVLVELPDEVNGVAMAEKYKKDKGLVPAEAPPTKPAPHYADTKPQAPQKAAQFHGKKDGGVRAADKD